MTFDWIVISSSYLQLECKRFMSHKLWAGFELIIFDSNNTHKHSNFYNWSSIWPVKYDQKKARFTIKNGPIFWTYENSNIWELDSRLFSKFEFKIGSENDSERSESEIGILFRCDSSIKIYSVNLMFQLIPFLNQRHKTELEFLVRREWQVHRYHFHQRLLHQWCLQLVSHRYH